MNKTKLIVMLTHNDYTVSNALSVFEECKHTSAVYWGAKEKGITPDELKQLFAEIRKNGKVCVLEVVEYTEKACLEGAELAIACGCDILLGTSFYDSVNKLCHRHGIRYMPFVGNIENRPSVLNGTINEMVEQADVYRKKGADGIDLLGYRYTGNGYVLSRDFVARTSTAVCLAGSINSIERLDEVRKIAPDFFTIGGAFFDHSFGDSIPEQIEFVCNYIKQKED